MTLDEVLQAAEIRNLKLSDVDAYCAQSGVVFSKTLDIASHAIAHRYAENEISYTTGDAVVNMLFAYAARKGDIPGLTFSIFRAFDAGEFYPDAIQQPALDERFTRPQIAAILGKEGSV